MKKLPSILIKLDLDDTPKFLAAVDRASGNGWSRDPRQPHPEDDEENMVFYRGEFGQPRSLALNLFRTDSETIETGCVIPYDVKLTPLEYQAVLDDFRQNVLNRVLHAGFFIAIVTRIREVRVEPGPPSLWPPSDLTF